MCSNQKDVIVFNSKCIFKILQRIKSNEQVKRLINTVTIHLEGENDELFERPATPEKGNSKNKSREVKKQSKQSFEFKDLPFPQKRKHKYTGRVGSNAEMMRQYYKAKIFITNNYLLSQAPILPKDLVL